MKTQTLPAYPCHKGLDWSYPSSTNATQAGFGRAGCWTVSAHDIAGKLSPVALASFPLRPDALAFARALPVAWTHSFRGIHAEDAK